MYLSLNTLNKTPKNTRNLLDASNYDFRYVLTTTMPRNSPARSRAKGKFSMTPLQLCALLHRHIIWLYRQTRYDKDRAEKEIEAFTRLSKKKELDAAILSVIRDSILKVVPHETDRFQAELDRVLDDAEDKLEKSSSYKIYVYL